MIISQRQEEILNIVIAVKQASISQIKKRLATDISTPTLNRDLSRLVANKFLIKKGSGRSTSYSVALAYKILAPFDLSNYFDVETDARDAITEFNHELMPELEQTPLVTNNESEYLDMLRQEYQSNIADFPPTLYQKELERLTIELSWKSSQIEGNTYSLLETEQLFLEKKPASDKPGTDAIMLLNHKDALHYILENKNLANTLNLRLLEEIHSLLIKDLGVTNNIRSRTVGITGSAYKPLDNVHQIKEKLIQMCNIINIKDNGFEKALLAVGLISYIQPFEDGNKRTARMVSNALLIAHNSCPMSYRSVDAMEYKKAMLLFYEQNNLSAFKQIFVEQNVFAVKNYFR